MTNEPHIMVLPESPFIDQAPAEAVPHFIPPEVAQPRPNELSFAQLILIAGAVIALGAASQISMAGRDHAEQDRRRQLDRAAAARREATRAGQERVRKLSELVKRTAKLNQDAERAKNK